MRNQYKNTGRVTIPTDVDVVPETLELLKRWGADAIRDCDGTDYPEGLKEVNAKVYSTYYTTRKDNAWAKANPDEVQQCYIMTGFYMAEEEALAIPLMAGISPELLKVNTRDDKKRWWEVMDRTAGCPVPPKEWTYEEESGCVILPAPIPYHEYTVSFLAYLIWDPVHMYNAVVNEWTDFEHQITFDVRQPKTQRYVIEKLKQWLKDNPDTNVVRFTTFFHQFTLVFDEFAREKFVDWFGYSASVSPYILEQFEKEVGYPFRPEYIIDQGYHNNTNRVPSREFRDFQKFQQRLVGPFVIPFKMNIPDIAGIEKQKPDTDQRPCQKRFPFPVLPDEEGKSAPLQQGHPGMGLPDDRPKLSKAIQRQIHFIGICPGRQPPYQDLMIPAQVQKPFRRITLDPNFHISAYVTKDCLYHIGYLSFICRIPGSIWFL